MNWRERFTQYLQAERRLSAHTVESYLRDLSQWILYLENVYEETPENASAIMARSWIGEMLEAGLSARSAARKISALNTFYNMSLRQHLISVNPFEGITAPKAKKRLPVFLREKEMENLLQGLEFADDFEGVRDRLILELLYQTGMRRAELIGLSEQSVDFEARTIKVVGKGNKERIIPVSNTLIELIQSFVKYRSSQLKTPNEKALLILKNGKPLYPKFVYQVVTKYLAQVSSIQKKSPHVLRHTFATHMLNRGADLNGIKEILGHASLAATQVYTHNSIEKLKQVHKKSHPRS